MKRVLITGEGSYIGENVEIWLNKYPNDFQVDTVDTFDNNWKNADFSNYDVVFHVAGIAHVDAKKSMESLYYAVNRDLTIEIAKHAKDCGVKQFIFMSSMIVYHESKSLKSEVITFDTLTNPNGFYGDSKLQAENGIKKLADEDFKVVILRPPMIYGPNSKGNFQRLVWLATVTPIFPDFHNKRSMLYIDNLCEFIRQAILNDIYGTFYPQNKELADTVEIVKFFAKRNKHILIVSKLFNPLVFMGSIFINALNKMFATYYYDLTMSDYNFVYQIVGETESFEKMV